MLALCMTSWTGLARLVRGEILELKESEYVMAARVLGTPSFKIITRHLIPNTMSVIIINTTFMVPSFYLFRGILKLYRNGSTASDDELGSNGITRTAADDILSSRVDFSGGSDFPDHVGVQPAWRWAS